MQYGNKNGFIHGLSRHPCYKIWLAMMDRCYNKKCKDFKRYGGRGILVCPRWQSVIAFCKDMSPRPHGRSIERIDNNKGYSKSNCRWANPAEQASNRRNNRYLYVNGEKLTIAQASRKFGFASRQTLRHRLEAGLSDEQAVFTKKNYRLKDHL